MKEEVQSTKLNINKDWCKGCGICVAFCPKSVLKLDKNKVKIIDDEKCIECGMCEKLCPDYAISLAKKEG
jgi:2-oxoglutarate ferredoxin oxidoreductase subunit delta